jgi:hypothetical protein
MAWEHLDTAHRPVKVESKLPEIREEVLRLQKQVDETTDRLHHLNIELAKAKKTMKRLEREIPKAGKAEKAKEAGDNDLDTETDDDFMVVAQGHPLENSQVTIESLKKFEQRMDDAWAKALKNLGNTGNGRNSGARYTDRLRRLHTWGSSQHPNQQEENAQGEAQPESVLDPYKLAPAKSTKCVPQQGKSEEPSRPRSPISSAYIRHAQNIDNHRTPGYRLSDEENWSPIKFVRPLEEQKRTEQQMRGETQDHPHPTPKNLPTISTPKEQNEKSNFADPTGSVLGLPPLKLKRNPPSEGPVKATLCPEIPQEDNRDTDANGDGIILQSVLESTPPLDVSAMHRYHNNQPSIPDLFSKGSQPPQNTDEPFEKIDEEKMNALPSSPTSSSPPTRSRHGRASSRGNASSYTGFCQPRLVRRDASWL